MITPERMGKVIVASVADKDRCANLLALVSDQPENFFKVIPDDVDDEFIVNYVESKKKGASGLCGRAENKWSGTFLHSKFIAEKLGLDAPYKQWGLYFATGTGLWYGAVTLHHARLLAKAVAETDPLKKEELRLMSCSTMDQMARAERHLRLLRMKARFAVLAPLLWVASRWVAHPHDQEQQ